MTAADVPAEPCKGCFLNGKGSATRCKEHGCSLCGGIMLADTEDWKTRLCIDCWVDAGEPETEEEYETIARLLTVTARETGGPCRG